jgi:hypothetical protein
MVLAVGPWRHAEDQSVDCRRGGRGAIRRCRGITCGSNGRRPEEDRDGHLLTQHRLGQEIFRNRRDRSPAGAFHLMTFEGREDRSEIAILDSFSHPFLGVIRTAQTR